MAPPEAPAVDLYLEALEREIDARPPEFDPDTVFIGGGTPTALDGPSLARLLRTVRRAVRPSRIGEWTVEANPGTLSPAGLRALRAAGVNRLSIGAQTFHPDGLALLGRLHGPDDVDAAVRQARRAGFENVGLDLIFARPGQTADSLRADLRRAIALEPDHVSCYALTLEEGTPLAARVAAGAVTPVSDETARRLFDLARRTLADAGYEHYEVSNFARPGRACRHNLLYWSGGEYLGIGPAAHSHWRGVRWGNVRSLEAWASALSEGWNPRDSEERLTPEAAARETLVFSLRRLAGVDREAFRRKTGFDYEELRGPEVADLVRQGLLRRTAAGIRLADRALFISDTVFAALI